jgi:hypothetical protein
MHPDGSINSAAHPYPFLGPCLPMFGITEPGGLSIYIVHLPHKLHVINVSKRQGFGMFTCQVDLTSVHRPCSGSVYKASQDQCTCAGQLPE